MFQRVGFSSNASVSPGGMSGAEDGAGQQPLQCPGPPGPSLSRKQLGWGGSVPLITGQLEGDPDTPNPARLLAHRIVC